MYSEWNHMLESSNSVLRKEMVENIQEAQLKVTEYLWDDLKHLK